MIFSSGIETNAHGDAIRCIIFPIGDIDCCEQADITRQILTCQIRDGRVDGAVQLSGPGS